MSSSDGVSDSQASQVSSYSLGLSQETMNQVMGAVGLSTREGDRLLEEFHADLDDDVDPVNQGSSTISISRAVFFANSQVSSDPSSPLSLQVVNSPLSTATAPYTPTSGRSGFSHEENGISPSITHSPTPPPPSQMYSPPPPLYHPPTFHSSQPPSSQPSQLRSNIPPNVPYPGEYGFSLFLEDAKYPTTKSPYVTYSRSVQRMYIKKDSVVPVTFTSTKPLPPSFHIRGMAIHKQPEMISENLLCCAKHVDEMRRKGVLHPYHFIRSTMEGCMYYGDHTSQRLSIQLPVSVLQKTSSNSYTGLYQFPCFTSDFQRSGQLVQLIFTLEYDMTVLGRATVDVRVCASPGRDKGADEKKLGSMGGASAATEEPTGPRKRRKRDPSSLQGGEEVVQFTHPPKLCRKLSSEKVEHTIRTYPELIPFIEDSVKLFERLYHIPVDVGRAHFHDNRDGAGPSQVPSLSLSRQDSFPPLDQWLEGLGLSQYQPIFARQGVRDLFQVMSLTDQELKAWGITNGSHRTRLLDSIKSLQEKQEKNQERVESAVPCHPLPSSQSQSQSSTTHTTQPFQGTIEVLQIQCRKTYK